MLPKVLERFVLPTDSRISRRRFLIGAAATTAGLAIGFRAAGAAETAEQGAGKLVEQNPFQSYLEIAADGRVTILSSQFDMGQGSYHGIATLVVEELGADWSQIDVVGASADVGLYGNIAWGGTAQGTGGSTTVVTIWERYRKAAATARAMLVEAAAESWGVPASEITVSAGMLSHGSGKSAGFGTFAEAAAKLPVPLEITLKPRDAWTEIGNGQVRRFDRVGKTTGAQDFTIDIDLPGMLTAVMIHPPRFGGTVKSFDADAARKVPGVVDVVAIHRGVAVVAKDTWSALQAREAVSVEWDESKAEKRGSAEILKGYHDLVAGPPAVIARKDGDSAAAIKGAAKVLEATFEFPFLAHAAMEPLNAVARFNADGTLEVWGGHQIPDLYIHVAAKLGGVEPAKVKLHVMKTGGGFGRRASPDADVVGEAVAIAKAIGAPVKLQWTRENDTRGGRYRPAYVHRLRGGLDGDGNLVAWEHHIVGQSILAGTPFQGMIQNGIDVTSVEGAQNLPYAIPAMTVGLTTTEVGIPVLWWRSVGSTHTAYATEVFIDELAEAAGKDPVAFRLALLKDHPKHAEALRAAADLAGDPQPGRHRGVAVHESFSTTVAQVADVSVEDGEVKVHEVAAAVNVGTAINPDTVRAQVEGGIGFGLGSILQEELTLTDGMVDQGNYDEYLPLRLDQMPEVKVAIIDSTENPTGIGEPGVPPVGPAVANAVYQATGKRVRVLPFTKGMGG